MLSAGQASDAKADLRFMQLARYVAGSDLADPQALGGFWSADVQPKPIPDLKLLGRATMATLKRVGERLVLTLANSGKEVAWIHAGDSNLLGFLEAKDTGGNWRPIEYQPWYTCGNSYHRVGLPSGQGWTFTVPVPPGNLKTQVRWRHQRRGETIYSNSLATTIPSTRFDLEPAVRAKSKVRYDGDFPFLVPHSFPL